ncbi:MAG: cbb3-type cytochrome c oxidase subunit II [bacterium]|nr:cbb3-type cytochrome c oxidase subunit II [bacterium]
MANSLYKSPIWFTIVATLVILIGTVATVFYPMFTEQMHPVLEDLKPYTPLQLAGRDIYQREGCVTCHTQTVRPLKTEVMRYGEYSKAGEFAYDRPFLWGSKRTGPDLARIGGKYPDAWHYMHFDNPTFAYAESNMPAYGFLKEVRLKPAVIERHMKAIGFPFEPDQIAALGEKNEMDALVAYLQVVGRAVTGKKKAAVPVAAVEEVNPLTVTPKVVHDGEELFEEHCAMCHGEVGEGDIGPSLQDNVWIGQAGHVSDGVIFTIIHGGLEEGQELAGRKAEGGMPEYGSSLKREEIWSMVAYIRTLQQN